MYERISTTEWVQNIRRGRTDADMNVTPAPEQAGHIPWIRTH